MRRATPTSRSRSAGCRSAIKELEPVAGWPRDRGIARVPRSHRDHDVDRRRTPARARRRGAGRPDDRERVRRAQRRASRKLNGVTHNPWRHGRTTGGSSAGSAAAVAGGLVTLATGGDGGGSIRIPAGYTGLLGMKGTYGRIPRGPARVLPARTRSCSAASPARCRDAARYYDVCAGYDPHDPSSLPTPGGWEAGLGTHDLPGRRVAVDPRARRRDRSSPGSRQRVRAIGARR